MNLAESNTFSRSFGKKEYTINHSLAKMTKTLFIYSILVGANFSM